ncbi:hypothetical protein BDV26DRAFT_268736 [Aspergillus bertholletiae]|uniref:Uncharacterized protein n=1 Tax=Aspergillus bertholletiae TaxID=1226010 RepID=A0A5N7AYR3_9EURO|nr:hypothetical protein BDV26DRAFT_268736 [Aspergillus bertholletiae]
MPLGVSLPGCFPRLWPCGFVGGSSFRIGTGLTLENSRCAHLNLHCLATGMIFSHLVWTAIQEWVLYHLVVW